MKHQCQTYLQFDPTCNMIGSSLAKLFSLVNLFFFALIMPFSLVKITRLARFTWIHRVKKGQDLAGPRRPRAAQTVKTPRR